MRAIAQRAGGRSLLFINQQSEEEKRQNCNEDKHQEGNAP
jgi:hypothetical protein